MPRQRRMPDEEPPEAAAGPQDAITDPPDAAEEAMPHPPLPLSREEQTRLRQKLQAKYH